MVVQEITDRDQWDKYTKDKVPVVVDFYATWCGPCKAISPLLNTLSEKEEYKGKLNFIKVDVDQHEAIAQEIGIRAMPTFMVFKDGEKKDTLLGANPPKLTQLVQNAAAAESGQKSSS